MAGNDDGGEKLIAAAWCRRPDWNKQRGIGRLTTFVLTTNQHSAAMLAGLPALPFEPADQAFWAACESWLDEGWNREATGDYSDLKLLPLQTALQELAAGAPLPRPITVAGTKGKGSTARLIEAVLLAHGQPTLTFSSPHLLHISERWRLDGDVITAKQMAGALQRVQACQRRLPANIHLTYFERCFLLAVALCPGRCFVCEVGLGGRLDCANALDAAVAVLTHVSLDHTALLGNTVALIAKEKMAIARADAPLIVAPQSLISDTELRRQAAPHLSWLRPAAYNGKMAMLGAHQAENAGAALTAAQAYLGRRYDAKIAADALTTAQLAGRSQVVSLRQRSIFLDGAHNDASLAAMLATAEAHGFAGAPLLLGLAQDKDAEAISRVLPLDRVQRVGYHGERSRQADDWPKAYAATPWHHNVSTAVGANCGPVIICGSFYLVGETLQRRQAGDLLNPCCG